MIRIETIVCGAYQENAYLVYDEARGDALIIDPGDDAPLLISAITESGKSLTDILFTHGHFDHIMGAGALVERYGARVHIHPLDEGMLASAEASLLDMTAPHGEFIPVKADMLYPIEESFSLDVCGMRFTGLHTPGHTPGGVSLILTEADALFTGDTLFAYGYGRYDFKGGNVRQLMTSLSLLLDQDKRLTVYSGHGEADSLSRIAARWRRG